MGCHFLLQGIFLNKGLNPCWTHQYLLEGKMKDLGKVSGRDFILLFVSHELYKMGTPSHQPLYPLLPDHSYEMVFSLPLLAILFLTCNKGITTWVCICLTLRLGSPGLKAYNWNSFWHGPPEDRTWPFIRQKPFCKDWREWLLEILQFSFTENDKLLITC